MDLFTIAVLVLAVLATAAVGAEAFRRPILWRMALRNAMRRPKQTATVIAGLMVGTAIISSALVAGDSARGAIRGYVYQSLGDVDESVALQAYPFFPQAVYERFSAPAVRSHFDAVSAHAIWQGASEAPRTGLFEPHVALVGYEPKADAGFGDFHLAGGGATDGSKLRTGEAIATAHLANALGVHAGDAVTVSYVLPLDPILPRLFFANGTVTGFDVIPSPGPLPVGPPPPAVPTSTTVVPVERNATFLSAILVWNATAGPSLPPTTALRMVVTAPNGTAYSTDFAGPGQAAAPQFLNVTVSPDQTLAVGDWTLEVRAQAAAAVRYVAVAVVGYPVYDAALLQERAKALQSVAGPVRDRLPGLNPFSTPRTAQFMLAAVTDGGRGDLFDLRDALFIRLDEAQAMFHREGQVNLVKFSNPGDQVEGEAGTAAALTALNRTLAEVKAAYADVPSVQNLVAKPLKSEFLSQADAKGQTLTGLLVFAGSLSIITGLLLILNIFTMLAEERRSELGMARAVGLSRGDLVRLSVFEGSLYAVAAAAIGAVLGLGLAYVMIQVMNAIVSHLRRDLSFPAIQFSPSLGAFLVAMSIGAVLTFATILVASARQSRINVVRAIRRVDEPEVAGSETVALAAGVPLLVIGLGASALSWLPFTRYTFLDHRFTAQVAFPLVAALGLGLLLRPYAKRHVVVPLIAAVLAVYYAATFFLITDFENRSEANLVGPIRGVIMTLSVVVLTVHFEWGLRAVGRLLSRVRGMRPLAMPALSYPLHRKFRTGMTLAMFSVVLLSIGFFSIFGALFQVDPARQTGGFDIEARTTLSVADLSQYEADPGLLKGVVASSYELPEYRTEDRGMITVDGSQTGTFRDYRHVVYGYDAAFAKAQEFHLVERIPEYRTDTEAYEGVLRHTDQVIVSYIYSTSPDGQALAHHVGEELQLHLGDRTLRYTVAGIQEQYHFPGIFLPRETVDGLFPSTARLHLYKLSPGTAPVAAAQALEKDYRAVGMDAKSTVDEVLDEQASFRQLLGAMKLFLGLGLLVGVLSLGIVTSRSVLERRQEIGMMRALGYTGRQVRSVFFLEVTATILLGAVVGIACAIIVTYGLWFAVVRQLNYPYIVPWGEVGLLVLVSYVVALLATWAPIGRTAKVAPAEALRYTE